LKEGNRRDEKRREEGRSRRSEGEARYKWNPRFEKVQAFCGVK